MATAKRVKKTVGSVQIRDKRSLKARQVDRNSRHDCLLIAVVCDIRGFTDLTARVDDYFQSNLVVPKRVEEIITAYSDFMVVTQSKAAQEILAPLRNSGWENDFALKSTGDGFLVAVEVAPGVDHRMPRDAEDFKEEWKEIALLLAQGLIKLIKSSKVIENDGTFGEETHKFLKEWGMDIGYSAPKVDTKMPDFRVAGSMAMGVGSLANRNNRAKKDASDDYEPVYDDAYGHPVNLAFRLCDRAARTFYEGEVSPYLLLDRRVARLLLSRRNYVSKLQSQALSPYRFKEPIKGIEEQWCYAFEKVGDS